MIGKLTLVGIPVVVENTEIFPSISPGSSRSRRLQLQQCTTIWSTVLMWLSISFVFAGSLDEILLILLCPAMRNSSMFNT